MVYRSNRKSRSNRSLKRNTRRQRGGDRGVHVPLQYFNPGAKVPTYYPTGHEMLTKPNVSGSYGIMSAVNTTHVNPGGLSMGPNLGPFPNSSGMMVGGSLRSITPPKRKGMMYGKRMSGRRTTSRGMIRGQRMSGRRITSRGMIRGKGMRQMMMTR